LAPGEYTESLSVNKDVLLQARDGGKVTICPRRDTAVKVTGGDVTLRGFTIVSGKGQCFAVEVTGGTLQLIDCDISSPDGLTCVVVGGEKTCVTLTNCTIHSSGQGGVVVHNGADCAVDGGTEVHDTVLSGLEVHAASTLRVSGGCSVSNSGKVGIMALPDAAAVSISDTEVCGCKMSGIEVRGAKGVLLDSVDVHHNAQSGLYVHADGSVKEGSRGGKGGKKNTYHHNGKWDHYDQPTQERRTLYCQVGVLVFAVLCITFGVWGKYLQLAAGNYTMEDVANWQIKL
jgi:hypothetical protein